MSFFFFAAGVPPSFRAIYFDHFAVDLPGNRCFLPSDNGTLFFVRLRVLLKTIASKRPHPFSRGRPIS